MERGNHKQFYVVLLFVCIVFLDDISYFPVFFIADEALGLQSFRITQAILNAEGHGLSVISARFVPVECTLLHELRIEMVGKPVICAGASALGKWRNGQHQQAHDGIEGIGRMCLENAATLRILQGIVYTSHGHGCGFLSFAFGR